MILCVAALLVSGLAQGLEAALVPGPGAGLCGGTEYLANISLTAGSALVLTCPTHPACPPPPSVSWFRCKPTGSVPGLSEFN